MKLVIVIPAYNEEKSIGRVIKEIPRDIADTVEIVVIDDGSTDGTAEVAKRAGANKEKMASICNCGHAYRYPDREYRIPRAAP